MLRTRRLPAINSDGRGRRVNEEAASPAGVGERVARARKFTVRPRGEGIHVETRPDRMHIQG